MPQLVKGGKWVFGWVFVGLRGEVTIPPVAWDEYGFQAGDEVLFLPGSRRSGGFGLSHTRLPAAISEPLRMQVLASARVDALGRVVVPRAVGARPGDKLLAVRGSSRALGFASQGPIFEEALSHFDLVCFGEESDP